MKKHKYLFVACLSLFPVMAVAGNDTLHEIMEGGRQDVRAFGRSYC